MIRRSRFLVMTSAMMAAILGCSDPAGVSADLELPEPVELTLAIGQTAALGDTGVDVSLLGVLSDSRCPDDVTCVWEGDAEVSIRIADDDGISDPIELHTTLDPVEVTWHDFDVTIVSVTPAPESGGEISAADYRVTLRFERR